MMKPIPFSLRWWHILIVAVVLLLAALVSAAFIWRAMGHAHYVRVIQQLKDQGLPASIDDYIALAPPVNSVLQDQWDAWQKWIVNSNTPAEPELNSVLKKHQKEWDRWVTGNGPRPSDIEAAVELSTSRYAPAVPLLRQGGLVLGGFGWIALDLPPGKRRQPFTSAIRQPNLSTIREVAEWLHHSTMLAKDPLPHLADLDAFHTAMKRPATLIDASIAIILASIRDRTYVELMVQGRLPDDFRQRWLSESCDAMHMIGDAAIGESILNGGMSYKGLLDEMPLLGITDSSPQYYRSFEHYSFVLHVWLTGYNDCALSVEFQNHIAQRLQNQTTTSWPDIDAMMSHLGPLGKMFCPNMQEAAIMALQSDADHRMARLAVHVIELHRMDMMPSTQEALVTVLGNDHALAPAGDHLHLRYEVPAPNRFRFVIDPASPLPNFDDPGRMSMRTQTAGTPAAKEPFVWSARSGSIEILLAPTSGAP